MPDDNPDFIDRIENTWKNWRGEDWSPEKAAQNFQLYGPAKRAEALDQFDEELRTAEPTTENLRRMSELTELRQTLDNVHHTLRKVGR